jgi:tetratricopeptide (TPR) repeat protein
MPDDTALAAAFTALRQGKLADAERGFRKIMRGDSSNDSRKSNKLVLQGLGIVLLQSGKPRQALGFFERAGHAGGEDAVLLGNIAAAHAVLGQHDQAAGYLRAALTLKPDDAVLHYNLGNAYVKLRQCDAAIDAYDAALARNPSLALAWRNKGNAAARLFRNELALDCYRNAAALQPDDPEHDANIAAALDMLNRREEARDLLQASLARAPQTGIAHWNLAPALLALGELEPGFAAYEYRLHPDSQRWLAHERPSPPRQMPGLRLQRGADIAGKTLYVHAEQGLGDAIQFCRYVKQLAELGAQVMLETPTPLLKLFETLTGAAQLIGMGQRPPRYDYHIPLISLPYFFATRLETIPASIPYLTASPRRVAEFAARLQGWGQGLRVGLAWSGNQDASTSQIKSAPLAALAPLFTAGASFAVVQKDILPADRAAAERFGLLDLSAEIKDFADTAGLMQNMDVIVSIDSAPLHLAGSLGRPTIALLCHAADWRWLMHREDSPWYPCMRLLRQETPGAWSELAARAASALPQDVRA